MIRVQQGENRQPAGELKAGEVAVKVHAAKPHTSKAGKESIHIALRTKDGQFIDEYVKPEEYWVGLLCGCFGVQWGGGAEFNEQVLEGLYGRVMTKVEPGVGTYPARLRVARWLKPGESAPAQPAAVTATRAATTATTAATASRTQRAVKAPPAPDEIPF